MSRVKVDRYAIYKTKWSKIEAKRKEASQLVGRRYRKKQPVSMFLYEQRDAILKQSGFLWWERFHLAQGSISTPTMKYLRRVRASEYRQVKRGDVRAYNEFARGIIERYHLMGWYFRSGRLSPFKMIDDTRKNEGYPDYPSKKHRPRKDSQTYKAKKAATLEARKMKGGLGI